MDALVRLQQQEYEREGITCDHIAYPDNSAQLMLLDHKSQGVYAMLDEECFVPGGSDKGFCNKICKTFEKHRRFGIIRTKPTWCPQGTGSCQWRLYIFWSGVFFCTFFL